jgi:hypothetical protein
MKLYVGPMDVVVDEVAADGRVRLQDEGWIQPSLQERRAIIYAAQAAIDELRELIDVVQGDVERRT